MKISLEDLQSLPNNWHKIYNKVFDIMEEPPKVSVRIDTGIENYKIYNTSGNYEVLNQLTGIFEYVGKRDNGKTISGEENPYEKKKKK